jgi:cytochrome P450
MNNGQDIYDNDRIVKSYVNSAIMQAAGVYSLFTVVDKDIHRSKRRVVGSAINERSMRIFEPTMLEQVDLFVKLLLVSSRSSKPVNISDRAGYLACDVVALLSLGFPLRLQVDPTYRFMIAGMYRANHLANIRMQWFRLQQLRVFSILSYFKNEMRARYKKLMEKMIATRLAEDKHVRNDLYSIVTEASSQGESIRMSDIWTEAMSFFPAGK